MRKRLEEEVEEDKDGEWDRERVGDKKEGKWNGEGEREEGEGRKRCERERMGQRKRECDSINLPVPKYRTKYMLRSA